MNDYEAKFEIGGEDTLRIQAPMGDRVWVEVLLEEPERNPGWSWPPEMAIRIGQALIDAGKVAIRAKSRPTPTKEETP